MENNGIHFEMLGPIFHALDQKVINQDEAHRRLVAAGVTESAAAGILNDVAKMPGYGIPFLRAFFPQKDKAPAEGAV